MANEQRMQVAEKVAELRHERGWSQKRLADEAGVSENTVLSIEQGKHTPQPAKLRAVLAALGVEPDQKLLALEGVPEDVRIFLTVALQRLSVLDAPARARVLADIYPRLLVAFG